MNKRNKGVRVAALVCVALLLFMYLATLIAAFTAKPYSSRMFLGCVLCTVFVPIFLHFYAYPDQAFCHDVKEAGGGYDAARV